ncbi:MAG: hypothetical protein KDJ47_11485 [Hyphomicrobiaceae bacterium]|nr:hypothetical protein [Hyphomicrobiaceae bacterium]
MTHQVALLSPDMTDGERLLILSGVRGEVADLGGQSIRGEVLRDLILGARPGWRLPPSGLMLKRAVVRGGLDLEGQAVQLPIFLTGVSIECSDGHAAISAAGARLRRLTLHQTHLGGAILADGAQFDGGLYLNGGNVSGPLQLRSARITGPLMAESAEIGGDDASIEAAGLRVSGAVVMKRIVLKGAAFFQRVHVRGDFVAEEAVALSNGAATLNLDGARIGGDVVLTRASLKGSVTADGMRVAGAIRADLLEIAGGGLSLAGSRIDRGVSVDNARIEGTFDFEGIRVGRGIKGAGLVVHGGTVSVAGSGAEVAGNIAFAGAKLVGAVTLIGANVAGELGLQRARLYGTTVALDGSGMKVQRVLNLDRAVIFGLVQLEQATLGASLFARGASLKVDRGLAISAVGLSVARDIMLTDGFRTVGGVGFRQAEVGGTLAFSDSHIVATSLAGYAPDARGKAGGDGARDAGTGGSDHAIDLGGARLDRLIMPAHHENRARGIVDLSQAHTRAYEDFAVAWPPPAGSRTSRPEGRDIDCIVLKGFKYEILVNPLGVVGGDAPGGQKAVPFMVARAAEQRIGWLEAQPADDLGRAFAPEAWLALEERLAAQGHPRVARAVGIARCRWQSQAMSSSRLERWRGRLFDLVALYGYGPWRTIGWLVALIGVCAALFGWAAQHCSRDDCLDGSVFVASHSGDLAAGAAGDGYRAFNPMLYSLDTALPLFSSGVEARWRVNTRWAPIEFGMAPEGVADAVDRRMAGAGAGRGAEAPRSSITAGGLLEMVRIVEMLLGGVLSLLAAAGFAGVLRSGH